MALYTAEQRQRAARGGGLKIFPAAPSSWHCSLSSMFLFIYLFFLLFILTSQPYDIVTVLKIIFPSTFLFCPRSLCHSRLIWAFFPQQHNFLILPCHFPCLFSGILPRISSLPALPGTCAPLPQSRTATYPSLLLGPGNNTEPRIPCVDWLLLDR